MTDEPTPQPQHADASLDLWMDGLELKINIAGPDDHLSNEAVHFAHWIGRNLPSLVPMARADLDSQTRIRDQARAIAELAGPPQPAVIAEPPMRRLVGPDGKVMQ